MQEMFLSAQNFETTINTGKKLKCNKFYATQISTAP